MRKFIFDLQRFADVTIAAGESYALDGVTYTAITDAVLNLADEKISGIASGKVTAVVTGAENSPTVTFDGTTPLEFTCAGDSDKLKVTCAGSSVDYTSGNVTYSGSGVTFQSGTVGLAGMIAKIIPYSINLDVPTAGLSATFDGNNLNLKSPDTVTATLNLPEGLSVLLESLKSILPALLKVSEPTFEKIYDIAQKLLTTETSIKFSGEATYNKATKTLSLAQDSFADINAAGYKVNLKAVDGALDGISVYYQKDGEDISAGVKIAAGSGDGKLKFNVLKNDVTIFDDLLKIISGTLTFDPINAKILMDADTSVSMTVRDIYTATITANNALSTTFSADEAGNIILTPENFSVKATLQRDNATIFDGAISIENGSIFFNQEAHSINVTKGTTVTLKQADYSYSFTATDDAGIEIVADNDGNFTLTPGENDGSLDISISKLTQNGTKSLKKSSALDDNTILNGNVSVSGGSIVFNPDTQSLSLTKGTKTAVTLGNYTFELTATDDINSKIVADNDGNFIFTPGENDGSLNVVLKKGDTPLFGGNLAVSGGSIGFNPATQALSFTKDTKTAFTLGNYTFEFTATDDISSKVAIDAEGNFIFTPGENDGSLNIVLKKGDTPILGGNLAVSGGSIGFNLATQSLSFTKGTKTAFTLGNYTFEFKATDDINSKIAVDTDGNFIFTPGENDGSLDITIKRGDTPIFSNNVSVVGKISFNPTTQSLGLADGTEISVAFSDYEVTATADGDAAVTFAMTSAGLSITPVKGDGTLNLKLGSESGSLSANLEVLSGSFILGENGALIVTKDTELQIDFGDGYIIGFKTTADAGGSISLGAGGITFVPNSDDGGLALSVTRNGETRTANLNVTGSITYSLNGSISLVENSVVRSTFEDGIELIVTAGEDASGTIIFNPAGGLDITPTRPKDFTLILTAGEYGFDAHNITGTLNYKSGLVTAYDGTEFYSGGDGFPEIRVQTTGGSFSLQPGLTKTVYTANEGATLILDYLDGTFWEIQNGSMISDAYGQVFLSEGTILGISDTSWQWSIILETAGNYTLNGMNVTTTKDNTQVKLSNYDTIIVDGISYTPLDENVTLTLGDTGITCAGGKVKAVVAGLENSPTATFDATDGELNFTASGVDGAFTITGNGLSYTLSSGSLTMSAVEVEGTESVQKLSFAKDSSISLGKDGKAINVVAKEDSAFYTWLTDKNIIYCKLDGDSADFDVSLAFNGKEVIGNTVTFGGTMSYSPAQGTFALISDNDDPENTKDSLASFNLGNYKFQMATDGKTVIAGLKVADDGTISINYPREDYNKTYLTVSRGDTPIFGGNLTVSDGSIGFNPVTKAISLSDGTKISTAFGDYELTATADGDAAVSVAMTSAGLSITPVQGDGTLNLKLGSESGSLSANLEVLSGSFILGENGALTITKDTELQLDFGGGYVVKFKTTDDAGGKISLGAGGLTFAPTEGDGHLELSVTRDGETRNASLEMTGSLTYKLDGSISLAKDTVLKNVFESGRTLTITANTDISGSIYFNPEGGLTITPATADALTLNLTMEDKTNVNITEIDGTITYNGGIVALADGTEINYTTNNFRSNLLKTEGGTSLLDFNSADKTTYTPSDGATLTITNGNYPMNVKAGTLAIGGDGNGNVVFTLSEGSNIECNDDELVFTLGTAGNYTLNGINVTTTKDNTQVKLSNYDTIVVDGISYTPLDDNVTLTIGENGATCAGGKVSVIMDGTDVPLEVDVTDGSLSFDSATKKFSFAEGAIISMQMGDNALQFIAKEDFSVGVEKTGDKVSFKLDGTAELEIVNGTRKTTLDFTGGLVYESGGSISLENGTEINLVWEDGNSLKLNSHGSNGSILLDADKGVRITSDDENLDMTLTTAEGYSSTISSIKGSLWYKAGTVTLDADTFITGKNTVEGYEFGIKFEAIDGTGKLNFANTGFTYSAGTGKNKVTYTLGDQVSSFTVNKGSVFIQRRVFNVAEGSDVATNFKDFIPAQYFKTGEAGTYTINGKTIETTAANLQLIATDDYMSFKTSDDVVKYDGMTFAGNGNVSLSSDNVVLGAGVEATGFGEDKSFVLAEAGNVTADAKVFELSKIEGTPREIPMIITVTGAQDGFTFSRTLTKESEAYLDDALDDEKFENYSSSYIGQVFTEKFIAAGDSSYRIRTDAIGLEEVIGISDGATVTGGASLADEPTLSYYNLVTDTTGKFTIGERTYNVSGDSSIALRARFEEDAAPYASMVDSLNGTISGDFSGGNFSINGSSALRVYGDTDISIVADENGYEILGLDASASLKVEAADTYKVNGTEITAGASSIIVGTEDGKASLYTLPAALADFMLHKTEAGYPAMAAVAFHPDEENPDPPTNYHSAEKWTTASKDDLQLSAIHYSPENPTGKWVILVHGYGKKGAAMNALAEPYLAQGLDVLIVDQRAAGNSEGDWLTMGVAEANDLAIWTQEIAKTNANAQITLHGVSMGAATVMLCAALPETTNLSAMIEDCGYGNIADVFATLLTYYGSVLGVSDVDYYELFDEVAAVAKTLDGGYDVTDAAPIESIAAVTVPSLFIHGAADAVIPSTNADALYEASGASNKTKLIVEGAGHAKSIELDTEAYLTAVRKLIDSSTTEIGALIDSNSNDKLLRGTIYNDTITNSGHSVTIEALDGNDTIVNSGENVTIDGGEGNDSIIATAGDNVTMDGGAGDDFLQSNAENVTMTGGAGADTFKGGASMATCVITDYTEGEDVIAHGRPFADMSINGSIVGSDYVFDLTAVGKKITVKDAADKVIKVVDANGEERLFGKYLTLDDNDPATVTAQDGVATIDPSARTKDIEIIGNDGDNTLISSAGNCTLTGNGGKNTYVRSSRSGTQTIVVTDFKEDSDEVYHGIPFANFSLLNIGGAVGDDYVFEAYGATIKYLDGANKKIKFVDVNGDVAYFGNYLTIRDFDADTVTATDKVKVLDASERTKAAQLTGNSLANTILGGDGNDTLNGGKGNDIIDGGAGSDVYVYNTGDGNDIIQGFRADSTLSIASGKYSSAVSGDDVIVAVDDGKITLTGAASLDTVNIDGEEDTTRLLVTNSDSVKVKLDDEIEVVDASMRTKPFVISGNDPNNTISGSKALDLIYSGNGDDFVNSGLGNDKIWGGNGNDTLLGNAGNDYLSGGYGTDKLYGGSGNDTLIGGKNNDSLWGNAGADTFIYMEGDNKDVIYGFEDDDMLQITGNFFAVYGAENNVISFKVGDTSNAIVLKDFTATTFNVNGDDYVISGNNKLVKK